MSFGCDAVLCDLLIDKAKSRYIRQDRPRKTLDYWTLTEHCRKCLTSTLNGGYAAVGRQRMSEGQDYLPVVPPLTL